MNDSHLFGIRSCVVVGTIAAALLFGARPSSQGRRSRQTIMVDGHEAAAGEVIVKLKSPRATINRLQLEQQVDAEESEPIGSTMRRMRSRRFDVRTLLAFLRTHPDVAFAEPNFVLRATAEPNDPYFPVLWGLHNTGQTVSGAGVPGADIHAVSAWDISTGSRANVVAVIDSGIDYTHPDLAANVWSAPSAFTVTIGGTAITCAAGTHGFNTITKTCDPRDDNNHGTHVSGTIGAAGNDGQGVAGVNWTASIMASKFLDDHAVGLVSDAVNAIEFTIQAKAAFASTRGANVRVLSNSWGGSAFSQALLDEINAANANDMLFVAAAGNGVDNNDVAQDNSTTPFYPANYAAPNVIAVAASDNTDHKASSSNYGSLVHLAAPGVNIYSTTIGGSYQYFSGTSMATPHVSGAAALLLSRCSLTTAALKASILDNVDLVGALTGLVATNGRLNVDRALRTCTPPRPPTISAVPSASVSEDTPAQISVTITDPDTPLSNVILLANSSNQALVPNSSISFSGSGEVRTMTVQPLTDRSGTTSITVTVDDGILSASTVVALSVDPVNDPPTVSAIPDQIVDEGRSTGALTFTIDDVDNPVASLTISGSSSNASLVPDANIVFGGAGGGRTVTITPAPGLNGAATITIAASDGSLTGTASFVVNVLPPGALVLDTFAGNDNTLLINHGPDVNRTGRPWTYTGAAPSPILLNGRAAVVPGDGDLQATIDAGIADVRLATDYHVGSGPGLGALAFRLVDADNFLLLEASASNLQLYRRQSGTLVLLASAPLATLVPGSTHRLEVHATGSALQGWWDGVLTLETVETFQASATRHGLDWNSAYDATSSYDSFILEDGRPPITRVSVTPSPVTIVAGSVRSVTAQAIDATNVIVPGVSFIWTTANPGVASVVSSRVGTAAVAGISPGTTTLTAKAPNGVATTVMVNVTSPPVVTHVTVTPAPVDIFVGGSQAATAQATDANNVLMPGIPFAWTTADPNIAAVTSTGIVSGVAAGTTTLTATAPNAVSATVTVVVRAIPSSWLVSDTFGESDGTALTSHAPDRNSTGHPWTLTGGTPAPTLMGGRATVSAGSGHLQATIEAGVSDIRMATDYRIGQGPGLGALAFRLTDANNLLLLEALGEDLQFYRRQAGTWALLASAPIGSPTVGSTHRLEVRATGAVLQGWWDDALALQTSDGFQQTATRHGLDWNSGYDATAAYDNFLLEDGRPAVAHVIVAPNPVTVTAGCLRVVTAQATDANNTIVPGVAFTWTTADPTVATVSGTGSTATVAGIAAGATTLTATASNMASTTVTLIVTSPPSIAHVAITPSLVSVAAGGTVSAAAQATDANNVVMPGATFTWTTADSRIATVTRTGARTANVSGVAAGTTTLTATAPNAVSTSVSVTVTARPSRQLVSDTFTGPDGVLLTSHAPDRNETGHSWTWTGAAPSPVLQDGRATVAAGSGHLQLTIDSGAADIEMATDVLAGAGPGLAALAFRLTNADNFLLLEVRDGNLQFLRRRSGTWTLLASTAISAPAPGSSHHLEVHATGVALEGWYDGVLALRAADAFQRAATRHGLDWNSAYDATMAYDNFTLLKWKGKPRHRLACRDESDERAGWRRGDRRRRDKCVVPGSPGRQRIRPSRPSRARAAAPRPSVAPRPAHRRSRRTR